MSIESAKSHQISTIAVIQMCAILYRQVPQLCSAFLLPNNKKIILKPSDKIEYVYKYCLKNKKSYIILMIRYIIYLFIFNIVVIFKGGLIHLFFKGRSNSLIHWWIYSAANSHCSFADSLTTDSGIVKVYCVGIWCVIESFIGYVHNPFRPNYNALLN